jgi:hypothetical protein
MEAQQKLLSSSEGGRSARAAARPLRLRGGPCLRPPASSRLPQGSGRPYALAWADLKPRQYSAGSTARPWAVSATWGRASAE